MTDSITHFVIEATFNILIIFSVLTWTLIFYKIWQFMANNRNNNVFSDAFWNAQNMEQAQV